MSKKPKGQGLVEFALILPTVLLLGMGLVALGLGVNYKGAADDAAKAGARAASTWRISDGISCLNAVQNAAGSASIYSVEIEVSANCAGNLPMARGEQVFVRTSFHYRPIFFDTVGNPPIPHTWVLTGYSEVKHW